jgi:hypothetical protein
MTLLTAVGDRGSVITVSERTYVYKFCGLVLDRGVK